MRNNICGTSKTNTSGRIMGVIPVELRDALKSVTKYTNNTGSSSSWLAVTATTDYFFLLSEFEVFGNTTRYANNYEADYQQQYAYYSAGNSKKKYRHDSTNKSAYWWLRSPYFATSDYFVRVSIVDDNSSGRAYTSCGFAPCFCV